MSNPVDPYRGQPQFGQPPQYGQPQYGQPQYGHPLYGQPQYGQPRYGYPMPGYGQRSAAASGVTAIVSSVLAILGAAWGLLVIISTADALFDNARYLSGSYYAWIVVDLLFGIVGTALLATGAVMVLRRKALGRWLIVGECTVGVLVSVVNVVVSAVSLSSRYSGPAIHITPTLVSLTVLVFPVATAILALVPATGAWCADRARAQQVSFGQPMVNRRW